MNAATLLQALHQRLPVRLQALRLPLLIALSGLVLGTAALWQSGSTLNSARSRLDQARAELRRAQAEVAAERELDARLRPALATYQTLQARGLVGDAQPEQWLEAVRRAHGSRDLQARFSPSRALGQHGEPGSSELQGSSLSLELPLLHEAELPSLLGRLQAERGALVLTRGCRLERLPAHAEPTPHAATLHAMCTLDWLTITPGAR